MKKIPDTPTKESILAAMRDAIVEKDTLIQQVIRENTKLKEENEKAWAIFDDLAWKKEVKP